LLLESEANIQPGRTGRKARRTAKKVMWKKRGLYSGKGLHRNRLGFRKQYKTKKQKKGRGLRKRKQCYDGIKWATERIQKIAIPDGESIWQGGETKREDEAIRAITETTKEKTHTEARRRHNAQ